jgi:hypothetical protein
MLGGMAEQLESFTFRRGAPRRGSQYDQYVDGAIWRLTIGEDVTTAEAGRRLIGLRAKRVGKKLRAQVEDGSLIVQAYTPTGDEGS